MNVRSLAVAAVSICSLAVLTVPPAVAAPTVHAVPDNQPTYHLSDSGGTVEMTVGATFQVSLVAATDGGYSWVFSQRPKASILKFVGRKGYSLEPSPQPTPPVVGAGTRQVFTFTGVHTGRTSFTLVEKRSFESGSVKHFTLTVKVK